MRPKYEIVLRGLQALQEIKLPDDKTYSLIENQLYFSATNYVDGIFEYYLKRIFKYSVG